jgi:hypothetical protein
LQTGIKINKKTTNEGTRMRKKRREELHKGEEGAQREEKNKKTAK